MTDLAIQAQGLSKRYRVGLQKEHRTLRDTIITAARHPFQRLRRFQGEVVAPEEAFWALNDVSINVKHGEVYGIIGRNGAGKSTLLKILSRITKPTKGEADVFGRVGSLLEVGTGFHPELTGRENIYLNGTMIGMKKAEIDRKFDEIVAFSGIMQFLDTPVKRYSSGMFVRLAFSVAAHLECEILLIDEVLAVGDAGFQKKCLRKMDRVTKEDRTVLFVSHNITAIQGLCSRVLWLEDGRIREEGHVGEVTSNYLKTFMSTLRERVWEDQSIAPGNEQVRLHRVLVRPESGTTSDSISVDTPFVLEFEYWNLEPEHCLNLSVLLYTIEGVLVLNTVPTREPEWHGRPFPVGLFRSRCHFPRALLNDGTYRVTLLVVKDQAVILHRNEDILVFDVMDSASLRGAWHGKWVGLVRPDLKWQTELIGRG